MMSTVLFMVLLFALLALFDALWTIIFLAVWAVSNLLNAPSNFVFTLLTIYFIVYGVRLTIGLIRLRVK